MASNTHNKQVAGSPNSIVYIKVGEVEINVQSADPARAKRDAIELLRMLETKYRENRQSPTSAQGYIG